jgi:hypothetical protein
MQGKRHKLWSDPHRRYSMDSFKIPCIENYMIFRQIFTIWTKLFTFHTDNLLRELQPFHGFDVKNEPPKTEDSAYSSKQ